MIEASFVGGKVLNVLLRDERETLIAPAATKSIWAMVKDYIVIGIEHILLGPDHLLFVLGLLLITVSVRKLIWAITAFTIAHSIELLLELLRAQLGHARLVEFTEALLNHFLKLGESSLG